MQELQQTFITFREECIWLRNCYNTYQTLFEDEEETCGILCKNAGIFFQDLNRILIDYIFLQVCKITDPEMTGNKRNLTINFINTALEKKQLFSEEINKYSSDILRYRGFLVDARNKLISHLDLQAVSSGEAIGEGAYPLDIR